MSILEVLKYQLSEPPTKQELDALPDELFNYWAGSFSICQPRTAHISKLLRLKRRLGNPTYHDNMKQLRKLLLEYDDYP